MECNHCQRTSPYTLTAVCASGMWHHNEVIQLSTGNSNGLFYCAPWWGVAIALRCARHLIQKEAHLPQRVWSTGDEKECLDTSGLPAAHLVQACGTGADHVVGVGVFTGALGRLHAPDTSGPWNEARTAQACQCFFVLGGKQRHGGDSVGEGRRVFAFLHEEGIEALHVLGELFRGLVSRARGTPPAIGERRDPG